MSTFPLPTLAFQITATGITAPEYSDIVNSIIASMKQIFGNDIYLDPDSQDMQLIAIWALAINDLNQAGIAAYRGFSPDYAQGINLSSLVKINGISRKVPTNSTVVVTLVGVAGTQIFNGIVKDTNGNLWDLPAEVDIPTSGTIDVTATAEQAGAITALRGSVNIINTPILGWQSATNSTDAVPGVADESDAQLRQRQALSTSRPAQTPLQSVLAEVANVDGVVRSAVYENKTSVIDANGLPPHSISVVVEGGNLTDIAQVIQSKKTPGTDTFGTTQITVSDPSGLPVTISFFVLIPTTIYINITIRPMVGYVSQYGASLVQAVIDFINALPIGDNVYYNWILSAAQLPGNLTYRVTGITLGTTPNPTSSSDIGIAFNQAPITALGNVLLTVS